MKDKMLKQYIKENYVDLNKQDRKTLRDFFNSFLSLFKRKKELSYKDSYSGDFCESWVCKRSVDFEKNLEETFVEHLFKTIDQKNLKDSEVYKKANIDRKLFSKIRSNLQYKPAKNTVLALAIALELSLEEVKTFLEKAGYALSKSFLTDVIVEYYIINKQYDIFKINQTLYDYKLQLLGSNI